MGGSHENDSSCHRFRLDRLGRSRVCPRHGSHDAWAAGCKMGEGSAVCSAGGRSERTLGDPGKDGLFVLRLKLPKGYAIPPHTHPKPEIVTVISGTFTLGMGNVADKSNAKPLPAGSFFAFAPGMAHYAFTDEETVVQINSTGP